MKELSIEEKAKSYDEALKVLHKYDGANIMFSQSLKDEMFPELKESEDKKVRRVLHEIVLQWKNGHQAWCSDDKEIDTILAWLKKQSQVKEFPISQHENKTCKEKDDSLTSEDERIRKEILSFIKRKKSLGSVNSEELGKSNSWIDWLEKDGNTNEIINRDEVVQGVLRGAAINLITWIDYNAAEGNMCLSNMECKDIEDALVSGNWDKIYAYIKKKLEKQGEQKPVDKVEPKFHEGDWLCENEPNNYARFIQILEIINVQGKERYRISRDIHNDEDIVEFDFVEKYYHKFGIQDAKAGDVLATLDYVLIFKKHLSEDGGVSYCHYDFTASKPQFVWLEDRNWYFGKEAIVYPATKEQRDLLFQKMKEAGYEWDAEKLELKKIEQKSIKTCAEYYNNGRELKMPVLSKFQDKLADILMHREYDGPDETEDDIAKGRLEYELAAIRLSEELLPLAVEQNLAWSEEDERYLNIVVSALSSPSLERLYHFNKVKSNDIISWFESLKDRVQPKVEWSDADKYILFRTIDNLKFLKDTISTDPEYYVNIIDIEREISWLKSLRPQSTCKPSEEQMQALSNAGNSFKPFEEGHKVLWSLYNDLKKLMGE